MTRKRIGILGSTGSIGRSTLEVLRKLSHRFTVTTLTAGSNSELLLQQIAEFKPRLVAVFDEAAAEKVRAALATMSDAPIVCSGLEGLIEAAVHDEVDFVVSAIVGAGGLVPTLAAIKAGKDIGLANKETLVMAGNIIRAELAKSNTTVKLLPIDSEHSAIFQVLEGKERNSMEKIILTASGGPFRNFSKQELAKVTRRQALNHPTWSMGAKISIDSATLMNKGLEVIEAFWLFDINHDKIDVVIHPQSIVHSLVEFIDGSVLAQMGWPDMRLPIAYALNYPAREALDLPGLNLAQAGVLEFFDPDMDRFPCLGLAYSALEAGGSMPAVLNAANEAAVARFLAEEISFEMIAVLIEKAMGLHQVIASPTFEEILEAHRWAKREVYK